MSCDPIKVIFFGDSICVGQFVSIHKGWVTCVSARLAEIDGPRVHPVVMNASANGRTTRLALEAMPYEVQSQHAPIVLLQFGMNDCNYWKSDPGVPRVSQKAFEANLEEIITRARRCGAKKILLNTNHPTALTDKIMPGTTISYQESNAEYNAVIRRVASNADPDVVVFTDIERIFLDYTGGDDAKLQELLLPHPDHLHLSERGHQMYFEHLCPVIEQAVISFFNGDG